MAKKKLLTLVGGICMVMVLVVASLVVACAKPAPAPTPAPTPKPAPTTSPAAAPKPEYLIRFASPHSKNVHWQGIENVFAPFVAGVSNGRIKTELYGNAVLGLPAALLDMLISGSLEMIYIYDPNMEAHFPWMVQTELQFNWPDYVSCLMQMERVTPELNKLMAPENVIILGGAFNLGGQQFLSRDHFIKTPADFKGLTIRSAAGGIDPMWLQLLGAKPLVIASAEVYTSFEQKIMDAIISFPINPIYSAKLYEVAHYLTISNVKRGMFSVIANLKWWNSLPSDIQAIIQQGVRITMDASNQQMLREEIPLIEKMTKEFKLQVYYLTPEERDAFKATVGPVYDWAQKQYGKDKFDLFAYKGERVPSQ